MEKLPARMRVTASRVSDHIDDVRLRAGDSILEMTGPGTAVALRDYAAAHLTVSRGEILEALEQVGSWIFCRNASGRSGWVRTDALEIAPED
jgi:Variant SH3 domain